MEVQGVLLDDNSLVSTTLGDWSFMIRSETGANMLALITSEHIYEMFDR